MRSSVVLWRSEATPARVRDSYSSSEKHSGWRCGSRILDDLTKVLFVVLMVLCHPGCGRRTTGSLDESPDKPAAAPKAVPIPMTNMVFIPAGSFVRFKYSVTLSRDSWLGKYEVTQAEYAALMGKNPSHFTNDLSHPVEKVSHVEAMAYCAALTRRERAAGRLPPDYQYRLPTEAEWEYACRAGSTNRFSFGEAVADADQYAWTAENSEARTHPIGQKRSNPWGLHDMHGNVWEWCLDWFASYPAAEVRDPLGPAEGKFKVFKGGGWNQEIDFARVGNRFMMAPSNGIYFVGFRVALARTGE